MHTITIERDYEAPAAVVWEALADFQNVANIAPLLTHVDHIGGPARGLGAERRCHFRNGSTLDEKIVATEGRKMTLEVGNIRGAPMRRARVDIEVSERFEGGSRLRFAVAYQMRLGPLGWLLGATVAKLGLRRNLRGLFEGLARHTRGAAQPRPLRNVG